MKVSFSRNSWHYRLQQFTYQGDPAVDNLCSYFWKTAFALPSIPVSAIGKVGKPYIYLPSAHHFHGNFGTGVEATAIVGFALIVLMAFLTAIVGIACCFLLAFTTPGGAMLIIGGVGLLIAFWFFLKSYELWLPYIWGLKNQVCPRITWND